MISLGTLGWACSSSDSPTSTSTSTTGTGPEADAGTGGAGGDAGADAQADSAPDADLDAGPQKPAECDEFTIVTPLTSSQKADPEAYLFAPDLNATPLVGGSQGDAKKQNIFLFFLDAASGVGSFPVTVFKSYSYASADTGGMNADYVKPAGYTRYAAVSGTALVTDLLTPHQSKGRISNVRYDEVTIEADSSAKPVPGGKCLWLKEATWDTERPLGCAPFTKNTCGDGKFCMPTNAIGDDGLCVTTGTKAVDEVCTPGNISADSDRDHGVDS